MVLAELPPSYEASRGQLHLVAAHVVARARHAATKRFGLRPTPGGFGTPAFGADVEVVRVAGGWLVRERAGTAGASTVIAPLERSSLHDLAALAGLELDGEFSVGNDTPALGDPEAPLTIDAATVLAVGQWLALGSTALAEVVGRLGPRGAPTVAQLWPEHFDLGLDVAVASGERTNLGASTGDAFHPEPYLYVGPWTSERPGDPVYWNAPFGAVAGYAEVASAPDALGTAIAFFEQGISQLASRSV
jgi:hypothetical protein